MSDNFENIFEIQYFTDCNGVRNERRNECTNLKPGDVVDFRAKIKLLECPKENLTRIYQIRPGALNEVLQIEIEMVCDCSCEKDKNAGFEINSAICNYSGNLTCGTCQCSNGKYGRKCECDGSSNYDDDTSNCKATPDADICSGKYIKNCWKNGL